MKKVTVNKDMLKTIGVVAGKIGKAIIWEGIKGVVLNSAANVIKSSFDNGIGSVKKMTLDDYLGNKKKLVDVPKVRVESEKGRVTVDAEFEPVEKQVEN